MCSQPAQSCQLLVPNQQRCVSTTAQLTRWTMPGQQRIPHATQLDVVRRLTSSDGSNPLALQNVILELNAKIYWQEVLLEMHPTTFWQKVMLEMNLSSFLAGSNARDASHRVLAAKPANHTHLPVLQGPSCVEGQQLHITYLHVQTVAAPGSLMSFPPRSATARCNVLLRTTGRHDTPYSDKQTDTADTLNPCQTMSLPHKTSRCDNMAPTKPSITRHKLCIQRLQLHAFHTHTQLQCLVCCLCVKSH